MDCIYINLDRQQDRRDFLEASFYRHATEGWTLRRIPAFDSRRLSDTVPGELRDVEKACFLSHVGALEMAMTLPGDVLILEDDACFGPSSIRLIDAAIKAPADWDLLYTDVAIVNPRDMLDLFLLYKEWKKTGQVRLMELQRLAFAGATAYVVKQAAKHKLLALLKAQNTLDAPYDLVLRHLVHHGQMTGRVVFPFATTLSKYAESSQIQPKETEITDACWNAFRRLVCADAFADDADPLATLRQIDPAYLDRHTEAFAAVLAVRLSENFLNK